MPVCGEYSAQRPRARGSIVRIPLSPTISRPGVPLRSPCGLELLEAGPLGVGQGEDELARFPVRDVELGGKPVDLAEAGDVGPGLERTGRDVEPAVDDAAVGLADRPRPGRIPFRGGGAARSIPGKLPQDGAADDAAADDDDIVGILHGPSSPTSYQKRACLKNRDGGPRAGPAQAASVAARAENPAPQSRQSFPW